MPIGPRQPPQRAPSRHGWCVALAVALAGLPTAPTPADDTAARGIAPAILQPPVVRGGVLLVPLEARVAGRSWPSALEVDFGDGQVVDGEVIWIGPSEPALRRRWTDDPSGLAWWPIEATRSASLPRGGGPYLVVEVPADSAPEIRVRAPGVPPAETLETTVRPIWIDPAPPPDPDWPTLARIAADDRPDPESPFDHWRWALLAQRLESKPPPPVGPRVAQLVAQHAAELWRAGLARLAAQSEGVAAECLEMLTNVAFDGDGRAIAAWVTDPVETATLQGLLLDVSRSERLMMEAALAWAESRRPLTIWTAGDSPEAIVLAVANARVEPQMVTLGWLAARGIVSEPIVKELVGRRLHRLTLPRPPSPVAEPTVSRDWVHTPMLATVEHAGTLRRIPIAPAMVRVGPPGASFGPFWPGLRLAEIRAGVQEPLPAARQTAAMIRRVNRRWEVFVECARPGPSVAVEPAPERWPPRGVEAITLVLGDADAPTAVLCVPELGDWWTPVGMAAGVQVHRTSAGGFWRARIVLPPEWIPASPLTPLRLGIARTHGDDDDGIEMAGLPRPAWIDRPAPLTFDLSRWDD